MKALIKYNRQLGNINIINKQNGIATSAKKIFLSTGMSNYLTSM